jgi:hypothetical protein
VPSTDRNHPGLLVEAGGHRIMIDCGEGAQRQLLRSGASFRRLDRALLTHGRENLIQVRCVSRGPIGVGQHCLDVDVAFALLVDWRWPIVPPEAQRTPGRVAPVM